MLGLTSDPRDAAHSTVVANLGVLLKVSRRSLASSSGTSTVMRDLLSGAAPVTDREKSPRVSHLSGHGNAQAGIPRLDADLGVYHRELPRPSIPVGRHTRASADVRAIATDHLKEIEVKIAELTAMRDTLNDLMRTCMGNNRPDCPIDIAGGQGMNGPD